jgi:hypothetical protein
VQKVDIIRNAIFHAGLIGHPEPRQVKRIYLMGAGDRLDVILPLAMRKPVAVYQYDRLAFPFGLIKYFDTVYINPIFHAAPWHYF